MNANYHYIDRYTQTHCISMESGKLRASSGDGNKKKKQEEDSSNKIEERMEGGIVVRRKLGKKVEIEKERR